MELLAQILGGIGRLILSVWATMWFYRREIDQHRFAGRDLRTARRDRRALKRARRSAAVRRREMRR